ncbi:Slp family lipoprotein [Ectothiorhodospiraceae bacterium 2226]|nr:Slp family lipoprotein [Ectothiorhodospiraceae bacterium 2226]
MRAIQPLFIPLLTGLMLTLVGCATSPVPDVIRDVPPGDLRVAEVRGPDGERFVGSDARWGGTIIEVQNRAHGTDVLVLGRSLDANGRPRADGEQLGRFIIRTERFLDPAVYARDREVTAYGKVDGIDTQPVGDYEYRYPVLAAEQWRLWQPRPVRDPYYHDPFYDPFYSPFYRPYYYDPWYPWGPWPYRRW